MGDFENKSSNENYDYDEIKQFLNTRYVSPPEAMYRLFKFPMYSLSHVIYRLAVHLQNEQFVYFKEGSEEESINRNLNTTLTAWFELNASDQDARTYLCPEIANFCF